MAKIKRIWFAHGEFEREFVDSAELLPSQIRQNAHEYFLEAIRRQCPDALKQLRQDVLPICQAAHSQASLLKPAVLPVPFPYYMFPRYRPSYTPYTPPEFELPPVFEQFDRAIARWAATFHLDVIPGLVDTPILTVSLWAANLKNAKKLRWCHASRGRLKPPNKVTIHLRVQCWDPRAETLAAANARLQANVRAQLGKHLRAQMAKARHQGLDKVPKKIQTEHFDWLALYQVAGLSYSAIARRSTRAIDRKTVAAGVKDAAQLVAGELCLQWLRRKSKGGRPRKRD